MAGATAAEAEAIADQKLPKLVLHVMDVSFENMKDPAERARMMNLPTSFVLPAADVDQLREAAGQLLRQSPEYQALLREWGGATP